MAATSCLIGDDNVGNAVLHAPPVQLVVTEKKTFPQLGNGLALLITLTIQKPGAGTPADRLSYLMSFFNSTHGRFI